MRWHRADDRNSHLCALVCILSSRCSAPSAAGLGPIPDPPRLVLAARAQAAAGAELRRRSQPLSLLPVRWIQIGGELFALLK